RNPHAGDGVLAAAGAVGGGLLFGFGGRGLLRLYNDGGGFLGLFLYFRHRYLLAFVFGVGGREVEDLRLLGGVRMLGAGIYMQFAELVARQGAFLGQHALHGLFDHALRVLAGEDEFGIGFLDAAGVAGVAVVFLVGALLAGELHLIRID